ncbi:hypothetical protein [Shewanella surugensis]|uniref:Uncharacterized protein n=1 Tax=Shewanella surugensis TaxID=212020 RepID=A0ABT0LBJ8_9GAMM|nr:hypothetical protein [Shewanella surugensis]MCL1124944.1 hypothetical protein [Shewanella surugensis]
MKPFGLAFLLTLVSLPIVATEYYGDGYSVDDLGKGFTSQNYQSVPACIEGSVVTHTQGKGELNFLNQLDQRQVRSRTFGELHGGVNLFIIAGSVSTSIYHTNAKDDLTVSSSLHLYFDEGHHTLENRQILDHADSSQCGDSFIYQVDYGRDIFLTSQLHFQSVEDYKKFVTKIKIRLLFWTKTKTTVKEFKEYAQNAVLTVKVNSNGAIPASLQALLDSRPTSCKGDEVDECMDTLNQLSTYLFEPTGLAQDMDSMPPVIRSMHTKQYQESGHYSLNQPAEPEQEALMSIVEEVEQEYGDRVRQEQRLKAFYQVAETVTEEQDYLAQWQAAKAYRTAFESLRTRCFISPFENECLPPFE